MNIYSKFKPTYLYIKRHSVTGMLYFGKTTQNPEKYYGSGTRWKYHISNHGKEHVETLWYCLFLDFETINSFALAFSLENKIVESDVWANLVIEDCVGGKCGPMPAEVRAKISVAKQVTSDKTRERMRLSSKKRAAPSEETRLKRSISMKKTMTADRLVKMSEVRIGKKHSQETRDKISAANVRRANHRSAAKIYC